MIPANPNNLYFVDCGRILCGTHLGMSARWTGHDISGQKIKLISAAALKRMTADVGRPIGCETCDARTARVTP